MAIRLGWNVELRKKVIETIGIYNEYSIFAAIVWIVVTQPNGRCQIRRTHRELLSYAHKWDIVKDSFSQGSIGNREMAWIELGNFQFCSSNDGIEVEP